MASMVYIFVSIIIHMVEGITCSYGVIPSKINHDS